MHPEGELPKSSTLLDPTATRVAGIAVNPYLLHVYWQVSGRDLEDAQGTLGESAANARPVLRFYDISCILFDGTNAHRIFDVEVDLRTQKWNVPLWSDDKSYVIDLGYKASDGRFHQIARSNIVGVPRAAVSPRIDERYLRVERGKIKSPVPVPAGHVLPEGPVKGPRVVSMHAMGKEKAMPLEEAPEPVTAVDSARTRQTLRETSGLPYPVPEAGGREKPGPVGDVSHPFDLVRRTEERFSFGVSSPAPFQGTNSPCDRT
jgi:hypothetical protein